MKICFQAHRYSDTDYINGSLVPWVDALAQKVDEVHVMTLDPHAIEPTRPNIYLAGYHRGYNRTHTLTKFFINGLRVRRKVDCFFVWQGGHYAGLVKLFGKPSFQWKSHQRVEWYQNFYSRYCNAVTFTASPKSYPGGGRVIAIGHGVDTDHFRPLGLERDIDFLILSRITRTKNIHMAISALAKCEGEYNMAVVGPTLTPQDKEYELELMEMKHRLRVNVKFYGPVIRQFVPKWLNRAKVFMNLAQVSALDRGVLEAMSCGTPILTVNECTKEVLGDVLSLLCESKYEVGAIADEMDHWMLAYQQSREKVGEKLREIVLRHHALSTLWDRILPYMKEVVK